MSTDDHMDTFGSNCFVGFDIGSFDIGEEHDTNNAGSGFNQIDSASSLSLNPWKLANPSSDFTNADGNHRDANSFVTPSHNASPNQPLEGILGATANRDQHIPIWSPNLSPNNHGPQQQTVSIIYDGWNNGWNPDVSIAPPAWDPALQEFTQSLSPVTPGFGQLFFPVLSPVGHSREHSNAIANGHLDPTLQHSGFGAYNNFRVVLDGSANSNSLPWWDDLTAIEPQATTTSFNQLPFPTTTNMPAAPALPTHATSIFTAPAVPRPIARRVASRRSNVNTNPYTCNYPGCGEIINRLGDFARHQQKHGVRQHPCLVHGCNRRGPRAFYRVDKLRDHQRKKHRMAI